MARRVQRLLARSRGSAVARRVPRGNTGTTKGTAFVVYEDIYDAKNAVDHLSGFNVCGRYLIVLYYQPKRAAAKREMEKEREELEALKKKYGVKSDAEEAKAKEAAESA